MGGQVKELQPTGKRGLAFHRLYLPQKIEKIRTLFGNDMVPLDLGECVLSINKARTCLVHRQGLVSPHDVNTTDTGLVVRWRQLSWEVADEAGVVQRLDPLVKPVLHGTKSIRPLFTFAERYFALGERIGFSAQEFSGIALTCMQFGHEICRGTVSLSESKGMPVQGVDRLKLGTTVQLVIRDEGDAANAG
jgi:hypothetical protein